MTRLALLLLALAAASLALIVLVLRGDDERLANVDGDPEDAGW